MWEIDKYSHSGYQQVQGIPWHFHWYQMSSSSWYNFEEDKISEVIFKNQIILIQTYLLTFG